MTTGEAILLGIVQGLTEFLPISSTAHLRIVPALLGRTDPGAAFTAVLQVGTLAAVLVYFWADLMRIARAMWRAAITGHPLETDDARLGWMIALGTLPIVVCGVLFKADIETTLRSLYVMTAAVVIVALILAIAEAWLQKHRREGRSPRELTDLTLVVDAVGIGSLRRWP